MHSGTKWNMKLNNGGKKRAKCSLLTFFKKNILNFIVNAKSQVECMSRHTLPEFAGLNIKDICANV